MCAKIIRSETKLVKVGLLLTSINKKTPPFIGAIVLLKNSCLFIFDNNPTPFQGHSQNYIMAIIVHDVESDTNI